MDLKSIDKVKILYGGEPFKGRVIEVQNSLETFQTPNRIPASTEINAKINLHFDEPWDNEVFEIANRFNKIEDIQKYHRKNGSFSRKRRTITSYVEKFKGYSLVKYHPQIALGIKLDRRDILVLIDLQMESGCDVITIPEPYSGCSVNDFEKNLNIGWEYISTFNQDLEAMPYISMNQDNDLFERKLDLLKNFEHELMCIGVRYASLSDCRPNLYSLAEFSSNDFWIHCSAGRRYPYYKTPYGHLHALQRYGIDTFSVEVPQPPVRSSKKKGVENIRYFDRRTIMYPHISEVLSTDGHLPCGCPICQNLSIDEFISKVRDIGPEDEIQLRVNDASKVHDVYTSTKEFENSRLIIKEDDLKEYFKSKEGLKPYYYQMTQSKLQLE